MPSTRVEDHLAAVDVVLAAMSDEQAAEYLERLTTQLEERFRGFQARLGRGAPPRGAWDAFDYSEAIAGLGQRAGRYAAAEIAKFQDAYDKAVAFNATQEACADLRKWQETRRERNANVAEPFRSTLNAWGL